MKKIYALFMTLCLVISATAAPLVGTVKGSYPLNTKVITSTKQLSLDATMQKAPAATQGMQYDATEGDLIRYYNESDALSIDTTYASEGQLSIRIVASDNSDLLSLVLFAEDTVPGTIIPEGTYPITSEPAYGTAYASPGVQNGSVYPSFYGMLNSKGQILTPLYFLESGNVVVEVVDGNLKISIDAANSNNVPMTIVYEVGGKSEKVEVKGPLKYDATEADGALDVTYGADATVELSNGDGYSILTVASPDATNEVDMAFFYDAADPETVIPAGTYTIDDSYTSGTVLASSGVNSQGQVSLSFYANLNASGQLVTPIYFLVSGTVEVTNVDGQLKVEVNAVNSNNVPIHIVYDATPAEPTVEVMELTMTNLQVSNYGEATGLWASDTDNGIEVMLFLDAEGNLMAESSIMVSWMDYNVTGTVTKAYNEELATDVYTAELYTTVGETNYKLIITMYSAPVVATPVVVENAEIDDQTEETGFMYMTGVWTDAEGVVYPVKAEVPGFDITVAEAVYKNVTVTVGGMGDEDPWLGFVQGDATITVVENIVTLTGVMSSWDGLTLDVTITATIPVVEPEKPEPTYTDNNLNPYAFGLESELSDDKSTLTMTYRLNNSKATDVDVVVKGGDEVIIIVNGTTNIGKNTVEISTEGFPGGVDITWSVIVKGTSVAAPTLEEKIYSFYHPSGVDIDNNPENETFGMLLVNEGMQSVASKTEGYVSAGFGAGIFAFTPSFDLIPNGELPGYNGGIEFTNTRADGTGTAYAPRRIRISEDGRIFVTSLNTDGNYLWEVNPDNLNEWTSVFKGTLNDQRELITEDSAFIAAPNNGFDVKGSGENLQLAMYSVNLSGITAAAMGGFRLDEYNLGTATEWAAAPTKNLVAGKYAINYTGTQVEYDNEGGFWIASYRGSATDANPGLVHINAEGVEDCKLVWNNVRQAGIRFNNDFTKLVVAGNNGAAKKATIYTISKDANGAPVLTQEAVVDMSVVGTNLNDFAWDYAGNLYSCGNNSEKLAAWAMPYSGEVETPAASKYAFQLEGTGSDYQMYEDVITNLVIDYDNMLLIGGPSEAFQVEVVLGLGDYDRNTDAFQLLPASTISVLGSEATFIDGVASVDGIEQTATAVVHCTWNGMALEFHLTMSAAPLEATKVVVENAAIEIEKVLLWGDMYDYTLKMTGVWTNEGIDYPVLVEVPVYYPEATEPYEIYSTVTVGGMGDDDPWLGFGEGYLTITQEGNTITATGIVENSWAGIAIDITISGTITPTGLENATVTVKPVKMIKNGQLIIEKDGVQYNVNGAIVK